jgi:hypothetical protein
MKELQEGRQVEVQEALVVEPPTWWAKHPLVERKLQVKEILAEM